jgi:membrane fusion protein (multidrug efflux system)
MRALLLPLLLGLALTATGCGPGADAPEDAGKAEVTDPRTLIEVASVATGEVASRLVASATIESEHQANVVPLAQGVVKRLLVEEGDTVRKGQLLAEIESPQLDAALDRARAELERAEADAEVAERLHAQGAVSAAERDVARRAVRAARTAVDETRRTGGNTRLTSPIAGTVATRAVRFGEVAAGVPAFTIVDLRALRVVVSLPERDLARVRVGQLAEVLGTTEPPVRGSARVERIAPVVDAATGTFRVTLALGEDAAATFRPGQFVSVRVEVDRHTGVPVLPRRALGWEDGAPYVYVVRDMTPEELAAETKKDEADKDGEGDEAAAKPEPLPGPARKAVRTPVKVGFEDGDVAEVLSGVATGASVVVVGNDSLRDGARVRLPGDPVRSPATAADGAPAGASAEPGK